MASSPSQWPEAVGITGKGDTGTATDVIYQRRVGAIIYAAEIDNVSEAARVFGVAHQTLSEWIGLARRYGLSALVPKGRRRPQPAQRDGGPGH